VSLPEVAALLAVGVVFVALGPLILGVFRARPASRDPLGAARLARISCEAALVLSGGAAPGVLPRLRPGGTRIEGPVELSKAVGQPPDLPPLPFSREWRVEAFRRGGKQGTWERVAGGVPCDLERVTVVIRDADPDGSGGFVPRGRGVTASVLRGAS
jgi:hypothetical protein